VIRPFPRSDRAFAAAVTAAHNFLGATDGLGASLEAALRGTYPAIRLRRQDPLANRTGGYIEVWYAFRDGDARE